MTPEMVVADDQLGQVAVKQWELFRRVKEGTLDPNLVLGELQRIIEGRLREDVSFLPADWEKFYTDVFDLTIDFSGLQVPARKKGFDRLIVVAPRITPQRLYEKCEEFFTCWKWTDRSLDEIVQSERTAKDSAYAVWFRDGVEADEDLKNLSANDLKEKNIPGVTLEERLLMELKYFRETAQRLDRENITLCSGSRCSRDGVPGVRCFRRVGGLFVLCYSPEFRTSGLRARRAVC